MSNTAARYVLQVREGRESAMADHVRRLVSPDVLQDCFFLRRQTARKRQGQRHLHEDLVFPGYLFLASSNIDAVKDQLRLSTKFQRLLGAQREIFTLSEEEASFVSEFGGADHLIRFSEGVIEDGRTVVSSGPLAGREQMICKIDRHKCAAFLRVGPPENCQVVRVGLEITRKS